MTLKRKRHYFSSIFSLLFSPCWGPGALIIYFFLTRIHQSVWWDRSPGVFMEFFLGIFALCSFVFFACICLEPQQVIMGEHLQQEQRGGDATGVAVLPAPGAAVPWLSSCGLQVRSGVAWVADQPEPRVGWPQVNPSPQTFSFLHILFFQLFNLSPLCSNAGADGWKVAYLTFQLHEESCEQERMTLRLSLNLVAPLRRS